MVDVVVTREDREAAELLCVLGPEREVVAAFIAKLRAERDAAVAKLERVRAAAEGVGLFVTRATLLAILDGEGGV